MVETEAYVPPLETWLNRRVAASEERLQQPRIASLIQARCDKAASWILTRPTRRRRPKGPEVPDRKRWLNEWLAGDSAQKAEERDWLQRWQQSPTSRQNQTSRAPAATKKPPDKHVLKLHKGLHKAESSILVQARTGKIGLRDFLFKRRVPGFDSPWCNCGQGRETVRHILVFCPRERERREHLVQALGEPIDTDRMLSTPGKAGIIARWLLRSGRLGMFQLANQLIS